MLRPDWLSRCYAGSWGLAWRPFTSGTLSGGGWGDGFLDDGETQESRSCRAPVKEHVRLGLPEVKGTGQGFSKTKDN